MAEFPVKELQLARNAQHLVNYTKGKELFEEDMVEISFVAQQGSISIEFPSHLEIGRVNVLKEYVELLDEAIRQKYTVFKEFLQNQDLNYTGEDNVCRTAALAFLNEKSIEPTSVYMQLMAMLQEKMCFNCIRMHDYYGRCLED